MYKFAFIFLLFLFGADITDAQTAPSQNQLFSEESSFEDIDFNDPDLSEAVIDIFFDDMLLEQMNDSNSSIADPVEISLMPEAPQPGQLFVASINDYSSELWGAEITWFVNDVMMEDNFNKRELELTASQAGTIMIVKVVFNTPAGKTIEFEKQVVPAYLDIIIEPQTRVPDFYQGRALPSFGSIVNATALINGGGADEFVYTWHINQEPLGGGPVRGSNQISFTVPRGNEPRLSLRVSRLDGSLVASRFVYVPSVSPELFMYEASPLYGAGDIAVNKNYRFVGNTAVLRAEPYNLDIRAYNNPGLLEWSIGNEVIRNTQNDPYEISLQRNALSGTSRLSFHVRNLEQVAQGVESTVNIGF